MLRGKELWLSIFAITIITLCYGFMVFIARQIPKASDFFGHAIGILGFGLMLMTETLYSLRKRSLSARWGRMSSWLEFHIFTGIVGPYMVLLHSSWKFNGIAGISTLFTGVVVISGFVGRYLYTRLPRSLDGMIIEGGVSEAAARQARRLLALWHTIHIPLGMVLFVTAFFHILGALYYATFLK